MFEGPQKDLFFLSFSPAINKNRERKKGNATLVKMGDQKVFPRFC
jgi:hypothetical protein